MKQAIITFILGSLLTGIGLGAFGFLKVTELNKQKNSLQLRVKKQAWQIDNLKNSQTSLSEELDWLKAKSENQFEHQFGALVQAKEHASWTALYQLGLKALQENDIPQAYQALSEVYKNDPNYKEIEKYYAQADQAYKKYKQKLFDDEVKASYLKAFDQQANSQFGLAQSNYQRVLQMKPNYKDAQQRLAIVSQQVKLIQETRDLEQRKKWLDATYQLGLNYQANGMFLEAKNAYEQILSYAPGFKDTRKRLNSVSVQAAKQPRLTLANPVVTETHKLRPESGKSLGCYQQGVEFGKCATSIDKENCNGLDNISKLPAECKDSPEFKKGLKSIISGGSQSMLKGIQF